jgi:predicted DNA-binding antitoxin AbrB/MazE fold protein
MSISVEAIYESGVLQPAKPIPELKDHERIRLIIETLDLGQEQARKRIKIDPDPAREIAESDEFGLLRPPRRGDFARRLMGAGRRYMKPGQDPIAELIRGRELDDDLDRADEQQ